VALVMHFTLTRALSGEFAYWCTVLLVVSAGMMSAHTLFSPPLVVHLLILVPVWLFGAWFSLLSPWFPSFGVFGFFPWVGAFLLYLCSLIVAGIVWDWARRRGRA
jgi:hypothetical protein